MTYRLYEAVPYLRPYAAFADCTDFETLRLWAVKNNEWKGQRANAVIVSDEGRFWYVARNGSCREVSSVRGRANKPSQVERLTGRLEDRPGYGNDDAASLGYSLPPAARWEHKTIHVPPDTEGGLPPSPAGS